MVFEVHSNHNPKESGYLRHFFSLILPAPQGLRPEACQPSGSIPVSATNYPFDSFELVGFWQGAQDIP